MSSEISIEPAGRLTRRAAADDGFRPWHFFVLSSILAATVAVILARQSSPAHLILLSLTIASAGAAAAALYRVLLPLLTPAAVQAQTPLDERTRAALQREKTLVLRSIKELEFDRAMGKLSPKDFDEMAGRLRARALTLMKQLERSPGGYGAVIERELSARLAAVEAAAAPAHLPGPTAASHCGCGTANDPDAVFCKKCGTRLRT
jgi:hypothetical protein